MKICTSCKIEKPESDFHRFGKDGSRVGKWCEACYTKNKGGKKTPPRKQAQAEKP